MDSKRLLVEQKEEESDGYGLRYMVQVLFIARLIHSYRCNYISFSISKQHFGYWNILGAIVDVVLLSQDENQSVKLI